MATKKSTLRLANCAGPCMGLGLEIAMSLMRNDLDKEQAQKDAFAYLKKNNMDSVAWEFATLLFLKENVVVKKAKKKAKS